MSTAGTEAQASFSATGSDCGDVLQGLFGSEAGEVWSAQDLISAADTKPKPKTKAAAAKVKPTKPPEAESLEDRARSTQERACNCMQGMGQL